MDEPAPAATPFTAHTVGTGNATSRRTSGFHNRSTLSPKSIGPSDGTMPTSAKSCPAQKPRPAPVRRIVRTLASASMASKARCTSACIVFVEAVQPVGPVQHEPGDAVGDVGADGFEHISRPPGWRGGLAQNQRWSWPVLRRALRAIVQFACKARDGRSPIRRASARRNEFVALADARAMGGRVKPGHDDYRSAFARAM